MNGSSVGKGTLAFRSYQAAGRACSQRSHGSFEQVKEVQCSGTEGKERVIEIEAGKEGGMRPGRALLDPG